MLSCEVDKDDKTPHLMVVEALIKINVLTLMTPQLPQACSTVRSSCSTPVCYHCEAMLWDGCH